MLNKKLTQHERSNSKSRSKSKNKNKPYFRIEITEKENIKPAKCNNLKFKLIFFIIK